MLGRDNKVNDIKDLQETYLLVGFPESGKSTFLAALISLLDSYADRMKLQKKEFKSLEGFSEKLHKQAQNWASFEPVERTYKHVEEHVVLELSDCDGKDYIIEIPDVSGELYDDMIGRRFADANMQNKICIADTILFFINLANSRDDSRLITDFPKTLQCAMANPDVDTDLHNYEEMTFQNKVVELLQIIHYVKQQGFRVKIILSAWDVLDDDALTNSKIPMEVVKSEFPLVYQFVNNNRDWLSSEIWGISAQGCDLENEEEVGRLSQLEEQIDRIIVVNQSGDVSCDLSELFIGKEDSNEE